MIKKFQIKFLKKQRLYFNDFFVNAIIFKIIKP
jgi:hypothetical protein